MANARQKKKVSARAAQVSKKSTRRKDSKRPIAARTRTELKTGVFPRVEHAPEWSGRADPQLTERSTFGIRAGEQHATEHYAGNPGAVELGTILASGMRSISQVLFNFMEERFRQNFTALLALTYCRTPLQLIEAQRDLICDNVKVLVRAAGRMTDISMQTVHEGLLRSSC
jgi:hypothetical protein